MAFRASIIWLEIGLKGLATLPRNNETDQFATDGSEVYKHLKVDPEQLSQCTKKDLAISIAIDHQMITTFNAEVLLKQKGAGDLEEQFQQWNGIIYVCKNKEQDCAYVHFTSDDLAFVRDHSCDNATINENIEMNYKRKKF
ncbi:hypothetical protein BDC45DRAFT_532155 [Circinella umbellata]|nr:hypothetical protein BDC45DRAFT_532155 [Circinella umbellata]